MTGELDMAREKGLHQRGPVWWLRAVIPKDLQAHYGRRTVSKSLRTTERREALVRAPAQMADWRAEFAAKRREMNASRIDRLTVEMGRTLAQGIASQVLASDDSLRRNPRMTRRFLATLEAQHPSTVRLGPPPLPPTPKADGLIADPLPDLDPLLGLDGDTARRLTELHGHIEGDAAVAVAAHSIASILPQAQAIARTLGFTFDTTTPGAREALAECLRAYRRAWADVRRRDVGDAIDTPDAPSSVDVEKAKAWTLRDVFQRWEASKRRKPETVEACRRALTAFEELFGPSLPLTKITRSQGDEYRAYILSKQLSSKTSHDRITWAKTLLSYAARDLEWIPRQPWEGIDIPYRTESPRRPHTPTELNTLFSHPLFTDYALPSSTKAGRDAAYWVPLLGLFTGARVGELCQLQLSDITEDSCGPVLRIHAEAEGSTVKSEAGIRAVPIHPELIRLGFLDYVGDTRKRSSSSASLWPLQTRLKGRPGAYFSTWYGELRSGLTPPVPDFHSFRHSARSALLRARIDEKVKDAITGHATKRGEGQTYEHVAPELLRQAVEAIHYPGLSLVRVYRA